MPHNALTHVLTHERYERKLRYLPYHFQQGVIGEGSANIEKKALQRIDQESFPVHWSSSEAFVIADTRIKWHPQ